MILPIASLLLAAGPASAAPPQFRGYDAGCEWDDWAYVYYWWFEAYVYDPDDDVTWATVAVSDHAGNLLAWGDMWGWYEEEGYTYWYYDFTQFEGGPVCPNRYMVTIAVYDYEWQAAFVEFDSR